MDRSSMKGRRAAAFCQDADILFRREERNKAPGSYFDPEEIIKRIKLAATERGIGALPLFATQGEERASQERILNTAYLDHLMAGIRSAFVDSGTRLDRYESEYHKFFNALVKSSDPESVGWSDVIQNLRARFDTLNKVLESIERIDFYVKNDLDDNRRRKLEEEFLAKYGDRYGHLLYQGPTTPLDVAAWKQHYAALETTYNQSQLDVAWVNDFTHRVELNQYEPKKALMDHTMLSYVIQHYASTPILQQLSEKDVKSLISLRDTMGDSIEQRTRNQELARLNDPFNITKPLNTIDNMLRDTDSLLSIVLLLESKNNISGKIDVLDIRRFSEIFQVKEKLVRESMSQAPQIEDFKQVFDYDPNKTTALNTLRFGQRIHEQLSSGLSIEDIDPLSKMYMILAHQKTLQDRRQKNSNKYDSITPTLAEFQRHLDSYSSEGPAFEQKIAAIKQKQAQDPHKLTFDERKLIGLYEARVAYINPGYFLQAYKESYLKNIPSLVTELEKNCQEIAQRNPKNQLLENLYSRMCDAKKEVVDHIEEYGIDLNKMSVQNSISFKYTCDIENCVPASSLIPGLIPEGLLNKDLENRLLAPVMVYDPISRQFKETGSYMEVSNPPKKEDMTQIECNKSNIGEGNVIFHPVQIHDSSLTNCILINSSVRSSYLDGAQISDSALANASVKNVRIERTNINAATPGISHLVEIEGILDPQNKNMIPILENSSIQADGTLGHQTIRLDSTCIITAEQGSPQYFRDIIQINQDRYTRKEVEAFMGKIRLECQEGSFVDITFDRVWTEQLKTSGKKYLWEIQAYMNGATVPVEKAYTFDPIRDLTPQSMGDKRPGYWWIHVGEHGFILSEGDQKRLVDWLVESVDLSKTPEERARDRCEALVKEAKGHLRVLEAFQYQHQSPETKAEAEEMRKGDHALVLGLRGVYDTRARLFSVEEAIT